MRVVTRGSQQERRYAPQTALVLTIFESKGLEFDEVFIFDFFADSPADEKTWRVITSCLQQQQHQAGTSTGAEAVGRSRLAETVIPPPRPVEFAKAAHSLLNEELKMLYTAITRARVKVVMYDQHKEERAPVFHYLLAKQPPLAQIFDSSSAGKSGMAKSSTPEEWRAQAKVRAMRTQPGSSRARANRSPPCLVL